MGFKELQKTDLENVYNSNEFDEVAIYYPRIGDPYQIHGIFDEPDQNSDIGVGVVTTAPTFNVIEKSLKTLPTNLDEIEIRGKRFRVRDYEPDGVGTADILLSYLKDYYGNQ
jgi:hypothetical protein